MIKPIIALAATAAFLAACGSSEETGPVEGPAVAASEAPRNEAIDTTETAADAAALTPGANSFTEAQAREAIEKQGYTGVGTLSQNENGIWSAPATREGTEATVSVDYRGVVTAQ